MCRLTFCPFYLYLIQVCTILEHGLICGIFLGIFWRRACDSFIPFGNFLFCSKSSLITWLIILYLFVGAGIITWPLSCFGTIHFSECTLPSSFLVCINILPTSNYRSISIFDIFSNSLHLKTRVVGFVLQIFGILVGGINVDNQRAMLFLSMGHSFGIVVAYFLDQQSRIGFLRSVLQSMQNRMLEGLHWWNYFSHHHQNMYATFKCFVTCAYHLLYYRF